MRKLFYFNIIILFILRILFSCNCKHKQKNIKKFKNKITYKKNIMDDDKITGWNMFIDDVFWW